MPIHLQTSAPLAERVLLPGDPGRALRLAKALIDEPKMFNHNRGLWGYSGAARDDGALLTIQSTGMGGPSAAIVIHELIELGARRLVRVGTCGALDPALALGELLVVDTALADDGTSRAMGTVDQAAGSAGLTARMSAAAQRSPAAVVSTDLFYGAEAREAIWRSAGACAVDMETATLFSLGGDVEVAAVLLVTDLLAGDRARIDDAGLEAGELRLGEVAVAALGPRPG